ncbi:hypothetical protein [Mycolicibacterium bacteremicum]|uniref:hypothetical protein n=1 Tax=Mycolicibacterium bacteremicum TaxID=564198 RepID=UPI0026EBC8C2|nr:hypothetical protein [Mycolicibacterium bacteremicum]
MDLLITHPWLTLPAGAAMAALWWWTRSRWAAVAALAWLGYGLWEFSVVTEGPDANIRLDLLLIYPSLVVVTITAVVTTLSRSTGD